MPYILLAAAIFVVIFTIYLIYRNIQLKTEVRFLNSDLAFHKEQNQALEQEKITSTEQMQHLHSKVENQQQLITDFDKMREESQKMTKAALFDLGNELSKQLIEMHKKENQETRELSEKNIKNTTENFNKEFERLVNMVGSLSKDIENSKETVDVIKNSLLSPSGAGKLAEITLENILKASGLRNKLDFFMQHSITGENEEKLRPDAVIYLPGNNIMIIDAKASKFLVNNQGIDNINDKNLMRTMNNHLRSLSSKDYAENIVKAVNNKNKAKNNIGNVITLMFLPTEHAVEKLIEADQQFMYKAWKVNNFPVGPTGLMNMLSFAKFQISEQLMMQNQQLIVEEVRKLLLSVSSLTEHSGKLAATIKNLVNHYDKFAGSFNRNFLSKAQSLSKLGINTGIKKEMINLQRYQLVTSNSEMIELAADENNEITSDNNSLVKEN